MISIKFKVNFSAAPTQQSPAGWITGHNLPALTSTIEPTKRFEFARTRICKFAGHGRPASASALVRHHRNHAAGPLSGRLFAPPAAVGSPPSPHAAAIANIANSGKDLEPVFLMIAARWYSTVRWLISRSAAIFLL